MYSEILKTTLAGLFSRRPACSPTADTWVEVTGTRIPRKTEISTATTPPP
jgi:hypothetical protein